VRTLCYCLRNRSGKAPCQRLVRGARFSRVGLTPLGSWCYSLRKQLGPVGQTTVRTGWALEEWIKSTACHRSVYVNTLVHPSRAPSTAIVKACLGAAVSFSLGIHENIRTLPGWKHRLGIGGVIMRFTGLLMLSRAHRMAEAPCALHRHFFTGPILCEGSVGHRHVAEWPWHGWQCWLNQWKQR